MAYKNREDQLRCQREWYKRNKEKQKNIVKDRKTLIKKWFNEYRSTLSCEKCPEDHSECLDFHHISDKKFEISGAVHTGRSIENIKEEISKCEVLCANCHRKLHYKQKTL